jgi:NADH-quinone oxidoreductase subunit G
MSGSMIIDGKKVYFDNQKNILSLIRDNNIDLPTFCYHSELSIYGACRMCSVETSDGKIIASCSEVPCNGMEIYTNSPRIRKYRKMILELLLSNHERDCTAC